MLAKMQKSKMKIFYASLVSLLVYSTEIAVADTPTTNNKHNAKAGHPSGGGHATSHPAVRHAPVPHNAHPAAHHAPIPHNAHPAAHHAPVSHQVSQPTQQGVTNLKHNKTQAIIPNQTNKMTPSNKITTHGVQPVLHLGPNAGTVSTQNLHTNVVTTSASSHKITQKNIQNAHTLNHQFVSGPHHTKWAKNISNAKNNYRQHFHNNILHNAQQFNAFHHNPHFHNWYNNWHQWGFFGGFWYPFYPCYNIDDYFYYPAVSWFYVSEPVTVDYYRDYYPSAPAPSGDCLTTFPYTNIYFPTDTLRDLLIEMSGLPTVLCNFREAVISFTSQLQQDVTTNMNVNYSFSQNGIVITYYQNLQNQAIVLGGYVSDDKIHMAFEGFLDLNNPNQSIAFVPKGQNPTADEIQALTQLNNRITALGGNPVADQPATGDQSQTPAGATTSESSAPGP